MRLGERALVGDGRRIEHGDIREAAGANASPIREPEAFGRHARHLVHRLLEREHVLDTHVLA
jgi:hypothetical protein